VSDQASLEYIEKEIAGHHVRYFQCLPSTNAYAKQWAKEGAVHGDIVIADAQSAGVGRQGKAWASPAGENIYMSLILRPSLDIERAPMFTVVMALAICETLQGLSFQHARIKWPNDILFHGKKAVGILTETAISGGKLAYVVIGVGINVNTREFPEGLQEIATSLYLELTEEQSQKSKESLSSPIVKNQTKKETRQGTIKTLNDKINREQLMQRLLEIFEQYEQRFLQRGNLSVWQQSYQQLMLGFQKEVSLLRNGALMQGVFKVLGIDEMGALLVKDESGNMQVISSGEVSLRSTSGDLSF